MPRINLQVGRTNTRGLDPTQAGYTAAMNAQMKQIRKNLERVLNNINAETPDALEYALKPMYNTSQRLVPKRTLALQKSGFLVVRKTMRGASASMGYGRGGKPFYAPIVHERLDLYHKNGTQAKFLEAAIFRHIGNVARRYRDYIRMKTGIK